MLRFFAPLLVLLVLTVPAGAEGCVPTTSKATLTVDSGSTGTWYVQSDACHHRVDLDGVSYHPHDWITGDCLYSIWFYEEANGIPGL